jgi:transcriptional regulator with PAS, ATPase and Fis domain
MDAITNRQQTLPIELQSLIDSHEQPFVVIDRDYRIMATNKAYQKAYCADGEPAIGNQCFKVSHHNNVPCCQLGEECPHTYLFENGEQKSCVHIHYDQNGNMHQVRVTAYPLRSSDGELYLGEHLQEISAPEHTNAARGRMVGKSEPFTDCVEQLKLVAATHAPVLLLGETGTGKELAASYIHSHSPRHEKPFLTVDCTTLADSLFEAEVFGHTKGAYTGSVGDKPGLFEQANGGTLFLDEIGEMPKAQQSKLLRILESGQYRRVGGRNTRKVNVRIICATNRHLWDAVRDGHFREDLYYRIACMSVRLPTLRERMDDIPLLARSLLEPVSQTMRRKFRLSDDAILRLNAYDFPGNVRELRNILFVTATQSGEDEISGALVEHVVGQLKRGRRGQDISVSHPTGQSSPVTEENAAPAAVNPVHTSPASLQELEAQHIQDLLNEHKGNRRQIAGTLGISERTLYRKLKKYGLG